MKNIKFLILLVITLTCIVVYGQVSYYMSGGNPSGPFIQSIGGGGTGGSGTGSQTPWLQNIDGGGFNLSNVGTLTANTANTVNVTTTNFTDLGATNGANVTNIVGLNTNGSFQYITIGSGLTYTATTRTLTASGSGSQTPWTADEDATGIYALYNLKTLMMTNSGAGSGMNFNVGFSSTYGATWTVTGTTNNSAAPTTLSASNVLAGSLIANGGTVSVIPTNAAPIQLTLNPTASLPYGITNTTQGRAEPIIRYYLIDGASGVPVMTLSNEQTSVKLQISRGSLASLTETNFAILPVTTTNSVWRIRDESTGSGASVGLITNWLNGL